MTTRIKITNVGPENAWVWYYNEERHFKPHKDVLLVGQSIELDVWDGHLPVVLPLRGVERDTEGAARFFRVPPATYY